MAPRLPWLSLIRQQTNDRAQIGEISTTSQAFAQARGNSGVMADGFSGGTAFDGSWHSVAFRRNGTAFELFVDGTRVASTTATLATGSTCNRTTLMHILSTERLDTLRVGSNTPRFGIERCQIARLWPYKQLGLLILRRRRLPRPHARRLQRLQLRTHRRQRPGPVSRPHRLPQPRARRLQQQRQQLRRPRTPTATATTPTPTPRLDVTPTPTPTATRTPTSNSNSNAYSDAQHLQLRAHRRQRQRLRQHLQLRPRRLLQQQRGNDRTPTATQHQRQRRHTYADYATATLQLRNTYSYGNGNTYSYANTYTYANTSSTEPSEQSQRIGAFKDSNQPTLDR